jgi:hypothetical protein
MIENPYPNSWQNLQVGVCRIFREIGLTAETEKIIDTPRGTVEIDVYAIDEKSVDKIKYLVECKNWESAIPQTVIHSFTTVMHETGANIGFIVSQKGLQSGATAYTQNTNISGFTYDEFQLRYFQAWYERYFIPQIRSAMGSLGQYLSSIDDPYRDQLINSLSNDKKSSFIMLYKRYRNIEMFMTFLLKLERDLAFFGISTMPAVTNCSVPLKKKTAICDREGDTYPIDEIKNSFREKLGDEFNFSSIYYRDLLAEILNTIMNITNQFIEVFGKDIFLQKPTNIIYTTFSKENSLKYLE